MKKWTIELYLFCHYNGAIEGSQAPEIKKAVSHNLIFKFKRR